MLVTSVLPTMYSGNKAEKENVWALLFIHGIPPLTLTLGIWRQHTL